MAASNFSEENSKKASEWLMENAPDYVLRCLAATEYVHIECIVKLSTAVIQFNETALTNAKLLGNNLPLDLKEHPALIKLENQRLEKIVKIYSERLKLLKQDMEE